MTQRPICSICGKRRAERFCPAKGERICAICCATEREVHLNCPADCPYLIAAHRYEEEHRKPLSQKELPFSGVQLSSDLLYKNEVFLSGVGYSVLRFALDRRELTDSDIFTALEALAETYRTLVSGIYYEKPPNAPTANALYAALVSFIQDFKKQESSQKGFASLKDGEIFQSLVYLARICRVSTNGRPRARIFLELLRRQYPQRELQPQASRIIAP